MCEGQTVSENNTRAELFGALRELAEIVPEMRAGQLVERVIPRAVCARGICFFLSRVNTNANHN